MWALALAAVLALAAGILWRWRRSGLPWLDFWFLAVPRVYAQLWHRWQGFGRPAFPHRGPALVVANHTCSADPTFLLAGSDRLIGFLVAREHYNLHPFTHWLLERFGCVGVTRHGRDVRAVREALQRLEEGRVLCLFPEGNLSGVVPGRIRCPKRGIAYLALVSRAPVYPVFITGGPRTHDLLEAWLYPSRKAVRVVYGPAIDLSVYYGRPRTRRLLAEVTNLLMNRVTALAPRRRNVDGDASANSCGKGGNPHKLRVS